MCGSTRAMKLLFGGSILDSFKTNPMAIMWFYLFILSYIKLIANISTINFLKNYKFLNIIYLTELKFLRFRLIGFIVLNVLYLNYIY